MIEEILGKETADDLVLASMVANLVSEKRACEIASEMEKDAQWYEPIAAFVNRFREAGLGGILQGLGSAGRFGYEAVRDVVKEVPSALGWTALLGAGTGALGAYGYDAIKQNLSKEDPEAKFNAEVEAVYKGKKRELEDAKWMERVRSIRDELARDYKKMPTDEYAKKYKKLVAALNERS